MMRRLSAHIALPKGACAARVVDRAMANVAASLATNTTGAGFDVFTWVMDGGYLMCAWDKAAQELYVDGVLPIAVALEILSAGAVLKQCHTAYHTQPGTSCV